MPASQSVNIGGIRCFHRAQHIHLGCAQILGLLVATAITSTKEWLGYGNDLLIGLSFVPKHKKLVDYL